MPPWAISRQVRVGMLTPNILPLRASNAHVRPSRGRFFDLGYPGLALRIGHGGAKSFELFYRVNGKLKRESLGRWPGVSSAQARDSWHKTREAIAKGEQPLNREGSTNPDKLFEYIVEEWLRRDQSKNKPSHLYQVIGFLLGVSSATS